MLGHTHIYFLCAVTLLIVEVRGEQEFQWKFGSNFTGQSLTECQTVQVVIESLTSDASALGIPPYYMFAFEAGGIPSVTMVGSNPDSLSWTATHKRGTSLMLMVMDSNRSSGGIAPNLYDMEAGNESSCLPPAPSGQPASINPNVTGTIDTCEPWGLTIQNGQKPYMIVLSALGATLTTNVTMGPDDNLYTWIDRANPSSQIMASVVDATGQWGISSNITTTAGSSDTTCPGLESSSQAISQQEPQAPTTAQASESESTTTQASKSTIAQASNSSTVQVPAITQIPPVTASNSHQRTRLIAGLVVGLGALAILALSTSIWLLRRRRAALEKGSSGTQDTAPRPIPFTDHLHGSTQTRQMSSSTLLCPEMKSVVDHSALSTQVNPIPAAYADRETADSEAQQRGTNVRSSRGSGMLPMSRNPEGAPSSFTDAEAVRYRKVLEASRGRLPPPVSAVTSRTSSSLLGPTSADSTGNPLGEPLSGPSRLPDIIIQHQDGGIVQELPPPYVERSGAAAQAASATSGQLENPHAQFPPPPATANVSQ